MKKILVPVDFSAYAEKAIMYAAGLAKKAQSEVVLMHCYEPMVAAFGITQDMVFMYNDVREDELMEKLNQYKTDLEGQGVQASVALSPASVVEGIITKANEENISLIVMGTLGATGLRTAFFGTKTTSLIAASAVPVIAVPYHYQWKEPREFLLAVTDANEALLSLQPVLNLAKMFGSKIKTVVFSNTTAEGVEIMEHSRLIATLQDQLKTAVDQTDIEVSHLSGKNFHETLQGFMQEQGTDLLVMITHKRNFLQRLFHFSATEEMAYHTTVPLMAIHAPE